LAHNEDEEEKETPQAPVIEKEVKSSNMTFDFAPVPKKLGDLIPNCNNLYRAKDISRPTKK
jgi:hypothetical protein